jgi:hypothetical protein
MALVLVPGQICKAVGVTSMTGGDFGPGTRGMLAVTVNFPNPITPGNVIVFAVQGELPLAGDQVTLGPILAFVTFTGGHSGIFHDYTYAVSYTDAAGTETMSGVFGTTSNDQISVTFSQPNPSINVLPGAVTWNVYGSLTGAGGLKLLSSGNLPNAGVSILLSSFGTGSVSPPSSPVRDTLGNSYTQCDWHDQISGGSNGGQNAMGIFATTSASGGANAIKFVCGAWNAQPFATEDGVLSIVAAEFTGALGTTISSGAIQQGSGTGTVSLSLTDSTSATRVTNWGTRSGNTAMVVDISTGSGDDSFFAIFCNLLASMAPDPPTPTLTASSYILLDKVTPSPPDDGYPMWFWYSAAELSLACPRSTAQRGVPYSSSFAASGGTPPYTAYAIISGSLPTGLSLNTSTGLVSGTPSAAGIFSYTGQVTDSASNTAQTSCTITVSANQTVTAQYSLTVKPKMFSIINTLRYEIPQKRWFPHIYNPGITYHYLDEPSSTNPNDQQLLMLAGPNIMKSGGDTDAGTDIQVWVQLASIDGGDERAQKLYVDAMTEADQVGSIAAQIQFNNQQIVGPLIGMNPTGLRQQFLENIASLTNLALYRNISIRYGFTGGPDGPRLYAFEPSGYAQPYVSTSIVTQFINLAFPGWKHHRRLYAGLISLAPVIFTIQTQDGRTYGPVTIPSTGGQFRIIPLMIPHGCKDLAFAYQLDGQGTAFALFPDAFTLETKEWVQPSYLELSVWNT